MTARPKVRRFCLTRSSAGIRSAAMSGRRPGCRSRAEDREELTIGGQDLDVGVRHLSNEALEFETSQIVTAAGVAVGSPSRSPMSGRMVLLPNPPIRLLLTAGAPARAMTRRQPNLKAGPCHHPRGTAARSAQRLDWQEHDPDRPVQHPTSGGSRRRPCRRVRPDGRPRRSTPSFVNWGIASPEMLVLKIDGGIDGPWRRCG